MDGIQSVGVFQNVSQRVAASYLKSLAELTVVLPDAEGGQPAEDRQAAQRDLHAFFRAFYETLYQSPERFGLPLAADAYLDDDDPQAIKDKQEVNRRLQKSRDLVEMGLGFLMTAGIEGCLEGQALRLDSQVYAACFKNARVGRKFVEGLGGAGLQVLETSEAVVISNLQFPAMMPALQLLAQTCAQFEEPTLGKVLFARCDFKALRKGYQLDPVDLYHIFPAEDYERLARLHEFFMARGYKTVVVVNRMFAWEVKYQGKRQAKATPLFQVEYQERCKNPLLLQVKCASANRLAAVIPNQSSALQADFFKRANRCNGDRCNWCEKHKGLGPAVIEYNGVQNTICWYVNPNVDELNEANIALIQEYALLHDALA